MKRTAMLFLALVMGLSLVACESRKEAAGNDSNLSFSQNGNAGAASETGEGQSDETPEAKVQEAPVAEPEKKKILVAYFSATNNTQAVAQKLAEGLGADLYEIVPEQPYTDEDLNYGNSKSRSSVEMNDPSSRPAISGEAPDMEQYDVVLIGYPIWWYIAPMIINTFLESYDFTGKTVILFATSGGSGFGKTVQSLAASCPGGIIKEGKLLNGISSCDTLKRWAESLE